MRRVMVAAALAMAACGFGSVPGGAAYAQTSPAHPAAPEGEEYCVYLKLTDTSDYQDVAVALLKGVDEDGARAIVKMAADACIKEMDMSLNQAALASDVGIYMSAADYLADGLLDAGVTEAQIDGLYVVIDQMSDDDLDLIFDGGWRDDAGMLARLKTAVLAQGIPNRDVLLEQSYLLIETSAFGVEAALAYLMADMADFDEEQS